MTMDLGEIGSKIVERMNVAPDRDQWLGLLDTVMRLRVP
jgi:hypothetical protein